MNELSLYKSPFSMCPSRNIWERQRKRYPVLLCWQWSRLPLLPGWRRKKNSTPEPPQYSSRMARLFACISRYSRTQGPSYLSIPTCTNDVSEDECKKSKSEVEVQRLLQKLGFDRCHLHSSISEHEDNEKILERVLLLCRCLEVGHSLALNHSLHIQ